MSDPTPIESARDFIDKVSTPTSRAGHSLKRVAAALDEGVSPGALAVQIADTTKGKLVPTADQIRFLGKVFEACKTRPLITASQTRGLINFQRGQHFDGIEEGLWEPASA